MIENELATIVVDLCFKIHKTLGPGLPESVYEEVLCYELKSSGLKVVRQLPVVYEQVKLELGFRADIIVEKKVRELRVSLASLRLCAGRMRKPK